MARNYEGLRRGQREVLEKQEAQQPGQEAHDHAAEAKPDGDAARTRAQERVQNPYKSADAGDMVSQQAAANAYNKLAQERRAEIHDRQPGQSDGAKPESGSSNDEQRESESSSAKTNERGSGRESGKSERSLDPETAQAVETLRASREAHGTTASRDADDGPAPESGRTSGRGGR